MNEQHEDERKRAQRNKLIEFLDDHVETPFLVQHENGLGRFEFAKEPCQRTHKKLEETQQELQKPLDQFSYVLADKLARESEMAFHEAVLAAPWWWRWAYAYGYFYFAVYAVVLAVVFWLFLRLSSDQLFGLIGVPIWAVLFGAAGGILRGIWWVRQHAATYTLRRSWLIFLLSPILVGAMLGIIIELIYEAGALTLNFDPAKPKAVAMSACFLAGYNWEWVNHMLGKLFGLEVENKG